jgi:hypothetical protein
MFNAYGRLQGKGSQIENIFDANKQQYTTVTRTEIKDKAEKV